MWLCGSALEAGFRWRGVILISKNSTAKTRSASPPAVSRAPASVDCEALPAKRSFGGAPWMLGRACH